MQADWPPCAKYVDDITILPQGGACYLMQTSANGGLFVEVIPLTAVAV